MYYICKVTGVLQIPIVKDFYPVELVALQLH